MGVPFGDLYMFTAFIDESALPPAHCRAFDSWPDVYNWTFRHGINLRLIHNRPRESSTVIRNLMQWVLQH